MTSLALPAALATAGLLSTAEAAYAAVAPDTRTGTAAYGHSGQPMSGDVTLTSGTSHPCEPIGNVTITDYGHCCPPVNNMTITDYGHCCNVGNVTIPDWGWFCETDQDPGRELGFSHLRAYAEHERS
ncbi:hypothetical protein [Streptomyces sp. RTd22]|uniref:hypothetical protein n=1 Tax=Streptomyces sp. RTd22 TaxID=1841249 RepID=UPI0007C4B588|nr:hypothetical protein [Streptomyces sp. RTd22]